MVNSLNLKLSWNRIEITYIVKKLKSRSYRNIGNSGKTLDAFFNNRLMFYLCDKKFSIYLCTKNKHKSRLHVGIA